MRSAEVLKPMQTEAVSETCGLRPRCVHRFGPAPASCLSKQSQLNLMHWTTRHLANAITGPDAGLALTSMLHAPCAPRHLLLYCTVRVL
jgi:hypothetical protein